MTSRFVLDESSLAGAVEIDRDLLADAVHQCSRDLTQHVIETRASRSTKNATG